MWFSRLGGEKSREGERRYACLISDLIVRKRVKETLGERERGVRWNSMEKVNLTW